MYCPLAISTLLTNDLLSIVGVDAFFLTFLTPQLIHTLQRKCHSRLGPPVRSLIGQFHALICIENVGPLLSSK